jgi:hypothetical protein
VSCARQAPVLVVYNEYMPVTGVLARVSTPFDEQDRVDLVRKSDPSRVTSPDSAKDRHL